MGSRIFNSAFLPLALTALVVTSSGCDTPVKDKLANASNTNSESRAELEGTVEDIEEPKSNPADVNADSVDLEGRILLGDSSSEKDPQDTSDEETVRYEPKGEILVNTPDEEALARRAAESLVSKDGASSESNGEKSSDKTLPAEANVATYEEKNQKIAEDWPKPQAVLFVSGQQHGYIEPCGCTGLDNQKGGLIRRDTLLTELRDRGWNLVPVDVGNQVRRSGPQPVIKFQTTVDAFKQMEYKAATLGVDDLKLSSVELIQIAGSDGVTPGEFVTANVEVVDSSFFPAYRIIEAGGRKIGVTGALGIEYKDEIKSEDVIVFDPVEKLPPVIEELKSEGCDYVVLLAHASLEESRQIAQKVDGIDLVVTAGGFGEPTLHPEKIEGSKSIMVQVGRKGMYGGIVGLFDDPENPVRYQKIAISSQFKDSERMLEKFANYQDKVRQAKELTDILFEGLGVAPAGHPSGNKFVGSEVCGDCHTTAFDIWENSPHVHATESIIAANNDRGGIARHHDPECIACHATGWNVRNQFYYPYKSGFLTPDLSEAMMGSGCENCHGPGSQHVDAENGDIDVDNDELLKLREQMVIELEHVRQAKCIHCHDLDNSPDFHKKPFEEYWDKVKHYGKD